MSSRLVAVALVLLAIPGTATAAGSKPFNVTIPVVTGTDSVGSTLSVSNGTWDGSPTKFAYQFVRCAAICSQVGTFTPVTPAMSTNTYTLTSADAGHQLYALVEAANAYGSSVEASIPTPLVVSANGTPGQTNPVTAPAPVVVFTAKAHAGYVETFSAKGSLVKPPAKKVKAYVWSFGDNSIGRGLTVTHRYTGPGTYRVTLTVTDNLGDIKASARTVHVR